MTANFTPLFAAVLLSYKDGPDKFPDKTTYGLE